MTQGSSLIAGAQVLAQRNDIVPALKEVEVIGKPEVVDVQSFGIISTTARSLGNSVIAEDSYARAMTPGGKPGDTKAIQ